jgi:hypothetical protein
MMMKPRISMFAEHEREVRRNEIGDPLAGLIKHVDFVALTASVDSAAPRPSRAKGGLPPYPILLMVNILVLQQLYNLSDDALEYQLLDRRSFLQLLELTDSSRIPDSKTIWLCPDRLAQASAGAPAFDQVQQRLQQHGYLARCGQIVDASLAQSPVQRSVHGHRLDHLQPASESGHLQPETTRISEGVRSETVLIRTLAANYATNHDRKRCRRLQFSLRRATSLNMSNSGVIASATPNNELPSKRGNRGRLKVARRRYRSIGASHLPAPETGTKNSPAGRLCSMDLQRPTRRASPLSHFRLPSR